MQRACRRWLDRPDEWRHAEKFAEAGLTKEVGLHEGECGASEEGYLQCCRPEGHEDATYDREDVLHD